MAPNSYDNIANAIDLYDKAVDDTTRYLRRLFFMDLGFVVIIPIVFGIVALFVAGLAGLLTTLGLGGVNAGEKLSRGHTALRTYSSDCSKLKRTVATLRLKLVLANQEDNTALIRIKKLLIKYLEALNRY